MWVHWIASLHEGLPLCTIRYECVLAFNVPECIFSFICLHSCSGSVAQIIWIHHISECFWLLPQFSLTLRNIITDTFSLSPGMFIYLLSFDFIYVLHISEYLPPQFHSSHFTRTSSMYLNAGKFSLHVVDQNMEHIWSSQIVWSSLTWCFPQNLGVLLNYKLRYI